MDQLVGTDRATGSLATGPRERLFRMRDEDITPSESEHGVAEDDNAQEELETSSAAATASTSAPKKQTKRRKTSGNGKADKRFECIEKGINNVAASLVTISKAKRMDTEIMKKLLDEIQKITSLSEMSQMKVYTNLTKDIVNAEGFLVLPNDGLRRAWLQLEFGVDIFDV